MTDDPRLTSDVSDFDFDRSADQAWQRFAEQLADVLSVMDAGATLAIGSVGDAEQGEPPHVRFTGTEDGELIAEIATDDLPPDAGAHLSAAGWSRELPETGPYRMAGTQEDSLVLAQAVIEVLRGVHGVPHPALLAPDQLADILVPTPVEGGPAASTDLDARAELDAIVERELTSFLGHQPLRDDDGDLALRVGSTMVFVRPSADGQEVLVFAALVHEVEGRSRAMEVLSDLNTEARWVRFLLIRDRVFVSMSVPADPLVPVHLHRALQVVSLIADSIDDTLAEKLRGRVTFTDEES